MEGPKDTSPNPDNLSVQPSHDSPTTETPEITASPENEFVGIMNSLESLNTDGRVVVDVIPEDNDRGLPKAVIIPARIGGERGIDGVNRSGTIFVTEAGVFLDDALLDRWEIDSEKEIEERQRLGIKMGQRDLERFHSWNFIDIQTQMDSEARGEKYTNEDLMKKHYERTYRNPELAFSRATPQELRTAKDRAVILASMRTRNPIVPVTPGAYADALK